MTNPKGGKAGALTVLEDSMGRVKWASLEVRKYTERLSPCGALWRQKQKTSCTHFDVWGSVVGQLWRGSFQWEATGMQVTCIQVVTRVQQKACHHASMGPPAPRIYFMGRMRAEWVLCTQGSDSQLPTARQENPSLLRAGSYTASLPLALWPWNVKTSLGRWDLCLYCVGWEICTLPDPQTS